jgi:hypothetical protein
LIAILSWLLSWFDRSWVDMGTILFGLVAVRRRSILSTPRGITAANRDRVISDLLNGADLFPFLVLIPAAFSSYVIKEISHSSVVTFSLSGALGMIWVSGELRRP